jgi:antitoxin (DNA-binding transcriptional repressor) of toxin-antitoxin stability system
MLDRVECGETIVIARNDRPVAELRPVVESTPAEVVARIRALRARIAKRNASKEPWPSKGARWRDLIHEGHDR